jgi:hypothetical protein
MCTGLANAFAVTQFSGSPKIQGKFKQKIKKIKKKTIFKKSFLVKKGEKEIRKKLSLVVKELVLLVSCKKIKCKKTNAKITNGKR